MAKNNFVNQLQSIENKSLIAIKDLFIVNDITELDVSNKDDEYDDVRVYCYDDDCNCADNIKIDKIVYDEGTLVFIDSNGFSHSSTDFHIGSLPYIYNSVYDILFKNKSETHKS